MKQTCGFYTPVLKGDGSGDNIEVGDSVDLVLDDGSVSTVTVTEASEDAKTISWDLTANGVPRQDDVRAVDGKHQIAYSDSNRHDDPYDHESNPALTS